MPSLNDLSMSSTDFPILADSRTMTASFRDGMGIRFESSKSLGRRLKSGDALDGLHHLFIRVSPLQEMSDIFLES
jgi:hypothetical protein